MRHCVHPLLSPSLGSSKTLVSLHYGPNDALKKVYIQASLHAEELPGMLVAHHLRALLESAEQEGRLLAQVVLVPVANPIGLSQRVYHHPQGRFELDTSENFNRHYPDLVHEIMDRVEPELTADAVHNVAVVRQAVGQWLEAWRPLTELESLRRQLMLLAHDADWVLDLHCDCESVMHLYTEVPCWPDIAPLAARLQCQAVLLAQESGGGPFDERLSGLWWQLADRLKDKSCPLPQGCASTTVELRGEADVSHPLAAQDAMAIMGFLGDIGVATASPHALPVLPCEPTPLAGSQTMRSPTAGLLVFLRHPGERVQVGDVVAEVIDPTGPESAVCPIVAEVAGVFYARVNERYVHAGGEIGKIAGSVPFRSGLLLGA